MPVEFLSDEQAARYGQYHSAPTPEQLTRFFYLSQADHAFLSQRRRKRNTLGCALQLCTLRYLGTFLPEPTQVPLVVTETLAAQLGIPPDALHGYRKRVSTWYEHQALILSYADVQPFDRVQTFRLIRWLYAQVATSTVRPSVLFDLATAHLITRRVALPGVTVLARLISRVRERFSSRTFRDLSRRLTLEQRASLDALLILPPMHSRTRLEVLRTSPTRVSAPALAAALRRIIQIRDVGVREVDVQDIPESRQVLLARHAQTAWAQTLLRMGDERRQATLLVFIQHLERSATDDVLELFLALMTSLTLTGATQRKKERLRTLGDLDRAALILQDACRVLLDAQTPDIGVRQAVYQQVGEARLRAALCTVGELVSGDTDPDLNALANSYTTVRRFLPLFLRTVKLGAAPSARPLLDAWTFLIRLEDGGRGRPGWSQAPRAFVPKSWQRRVFPPGGDVDHQMYTLCVLSRLQQALNRREIFAPDSQSYRDSRAELLQGPHWEAAREELARALGRSLDPATELERMRLELNTAYLAVASNLDHNAALTLEGTGGQTRISLTPLDAQPESASLKVLRDAVVGRLPQLELSTLLLEVQALTGFADGFTHLTAGRSTSGKMSEDLSLSLCAIVLSQACNIGLKAVARSDVEALSLARLSWVQQNYVRAEGIAAANARLVDAQLELPLAQVWGGGEVASADGLRFVVPVKTISAGWNSKYFGSQRGVTYYNFTSDQFTGFHGIVIPGTLRDSLFILAGLLEQQTGLDPKEIMADTHGSSDVVFGLFGLLGYQFSPRLADLSDQRFWRLDRDADYGVLSDLSRHPINHRLIAEHWDDLLRLAGSLKLGTVRATAVMRTLQRGGSLSGLGRAVAEFGRIEKTLYLLNYVHDEGYRRRILIQLNRGEGRHAVARAVFHGRKGELRQRYREGMEDQLGTLGLVVNAIVLWNTQYLAAALEDVRDAGIRVETADVARLSPLLHEHVNMLGRYDFTLPDEIAGGKLRSLRKLDGLEQWLDQLP